MSADSVIKVFVQEDCLACERTLIELAYLRTLHPQLGVKVYDRKRDREEFEKLQVHVVPAIFVNNKLTSYGGWRSTGLGKYLGKKQITQTLQKEVAVKRISLGRGIVAGLLGTAAMTMVMLMGPLMGMPEMNIGRMLGGFMGIAEALGWFAHFMIGTALALVYVYIFSSRLPGPPLLKGAVYGLVPWFVSQITVNPMMGAGFFASNTPAPFMMVMGSLIGHIIFGAVVGGLYGQGSISHAVATAQN